MWTGQLSGEICLEEQIADRQYAHQRIPWLTIDLSQLVRAALFMRAKNRTHVLETVFPMGKSESGALTTLPEEK